MKSGKLFDPALALQSLSDQDLLLEAVTAFLEMSPGLRDETMLAVERRDPVALRLAAHSWKGACSYIGAEVTRTLAGALESQAAEGRIDEGEVRHFVAVVRALVAELQEWYRSAVPQESRA